MKKSIAILGSTGSIGKSLFKILEKDKSNIDKKGLIASKNIKFGTKIIEYKASYGKTIICAYARIDGWSVGMVANQREIVKTAKGQMRFGGVGQRKAVNIKPKQRLIRGS